MESNGEGVEAPTLSGMVPAFRPQPEREKGPPSHITELCLLRSTCDVSPGCLDTKTKVLVLVEHITW